LSEEKRGHLEVDSEAIEAIEEKMDSEEIIKIDVTVMEVGQSGKLKQKESRVVMVAAGVVAIVVDVAETVEEEDDDAFLLKIN
jgi:hypothetical protein